MNGPRACDTLLRPGWGNGVADNNIRLVLMCSFNFFFVWLLLQILAKQENTHFLSFERQKQILI